MNASASTWVRGTAMALLWVSCLGGPAAGQTSPTGAAPMAHAESPDSPVAMLRAYLAAAGQGRWDVAADHLEGGGVAARRAELAERLKGVLDTRRVLDLSLVSRTAEGDLDDGLPPELERVAEVPVDERTEPLMLVRVPAGPRLVWRVSAASVDRIDDWYATLPDRWLRDRVSGGRLDWLLHRAPFGLLYWQWLALPFVLALSVAIGWTLRLLTSVVVRRLVRWTRKSWLGGVLDSIGPPVILAFSTFVFLLLCVMALEVPAESFSALARVSRPTLVFSLFWALWRSARVLLAWGLRRTIAARNASARSLLAVGANILRGLILGLGVLAMIASVGYPIGTVLAGLGIGGLALAIGAQKTVEHIFGSVALALDQPFRIGDLVRVNDFIGHVESIGLRSTRIRTPDRTLISIPNGKVADERIESFEVRDRMRLTTTVGLTYDTSREQLTRVLAGLEAVLRAHPRVWPEGITVRFSALGASSLDIEVLAWFDVPTWAEFQGCRQDVLLEFMRVVEEAGASFAFPTRTVHLVSPNPSPNP